MLQNACTRYDPVENLMTDIDNMIKTKFDYEQIYKRLYDPFVIRFNKYQAIMPLGPDDAFHYAYSAVIKYNDENDDEFYSWGDAVAWVYDLQDGYEYEKEMLPLIQQHTNIFDILAFSDKKETLEYS